MIYFLFYLLGSIASLSILHKYKGKMDLPNYDNDFSKDYDDWDSNAQAFSAFSLMWPVFWGVHLLKWSWDLLVYISGLIENKVNK